MRMWMSSRNTFPFWNYFELDPLLQEDNQEVKSVKTADFGLGFQQTWTSLVFSGTFTQTQLSPFVSSVWLLSHFTLGWLLTTYARVLAHLNFPTMLWTLDLLGLSAKLFCN